MNKFMVVVSGVIAMSVACAVAQDGGFKPAKHDKGGFKPAKQAGLVKPEKQPAPEMKELTLVGTISKVETTKGTKTFVTYVLKTDGGADVRIPKTEEAKLTDNLNVQVKVVGTGFLDDAKKKGALKSITSIEKVPAAAPEAPAK